MQYVFSKSRLTASAIPQNLTDATVHRANTPIANSRDIHAKCLSRVDDEPKPQRPKTYKTYLTSASGIWQFHATDQGRVESEVLTELVAID